MTKKVSGLTRYCFCGDLSESNDSPVEAGSAITAGERDPAAFDGGAFMPSGSIDPVLDSLASLGKLGEPLLF
jgi:hypothetical protein